jgi:hypothetical protein
MGKLNEAVLEHTGKIIAGLLALLIGGASAWMTKVNESQENMNSTQSELLRSQTAILQESKAQTEKLNDLSEKIKDLTALDKRVSRLEDSKVKNEDIENLKELIRANETRIIRLEISKHAK